MEEKNKNQSKKKTIKDLPSGIEEVKQMHRARKSKVNPSHMTLVQHEEAKQRIFKIFMSMFGICVLIGIIAIVYSSIKSHGETEAYFNETRAKLAELEATFSKESPEKIYTSAVNAAEAVRLAENMIAVAIRLSCSEERIEMEENVKKYRKVVLESSPLVDLRPFVASTAMIDMVPIKEGTFVMGDSVGIGEQAEKPCVEVTITKPFWIARHEITNRQFRRLTRTHVMREWNGYNLNANDLPAGEVSWDEAVFYCKTLTDKERRLGRVPAGYEYRLPTEAEWEYVCRAGTTTNYYWGDEFGEEGAKHANSLDILSEKKFRWAPVEQPGTAAEDGYAAAAPAGKYLANAWGIYDMSGNIAEWCYDFYAPNAYMILKNSSSKNDPCNTRPVAVPFKQMKNFDARSVVREIPCKVVRGGNWCCPPGKLRSSYRLFMPQNEKNNGVGFRPVLAPVIKNKISNTVQ